MKKIIIISGIILVIISLIILLYASRFIIGGLFISGFFNPPINQKKMEKDFTKNQELILIVTEYLVNSKYNDIYIPDSMEEGYMFVNTEGGDILINNSDVVKAIGELKKRGYSSISKHENTISFVRWAVLDNGRGVAYSINGNEPVLQFLTKLEPLPASNWYYYEEDFNEWKDRNIQ